MIRPLLCLMLGLFLIGPNLWADEIDPPRQVADKAHEEPADKAHEEPADKAHEEPADKAHEEPADKAHEETEDKPSDSDSADEDSSSESDSKKGELKEDDAEESAEHSDEKSDSKAESKEDKSEEKKFAKSKKKEEKKLEPYEVEPKPLKIEVKLDGVFAAQDTEEVVLRPEVWSTFKVLEAVEHGAHVKKGDVLVRFDDEKLEQRLAKESLDQRLAELTMMEEEERFPRFVKALELSFEESQRSLEQLEEDIAYYKNTDRPFYEKIAHYRYKDAQEQLASQREELEQLVQMYEADDLMEETEAIVLRRQRFQVETAELIMELQVAQRDYSLDVMLPRRDEYFATALEESKLAFEQVKTAKRIGLTRARYELDKKRKSRALSVEKHAELVSDRALMTLRAPVDGIVYYGKCTDGKWGQVSSLKAKLKPFGSVSANSVVMTIVQQRPLVVETSVSEKDFPDLGESMVAVITPTGDAELELQGKVSHIESVPAGGKKYKLQLSVDTTDAPDWLMAGMTCSAKVTTYENEEALMVPSDMVQTDEENKKLKYVMLVDPEEDEPIRRKVKLGRTKDKEVEVLKGLEEGDEIVKPEEEKSKD